MWCSASSPRQREIDDVTPARKCNHVHRNVHRAKSVRDRIIERHQHARFKEGAVQVANELDREFLRATKRVAAGHYEKYRVRAHGVILSPGHGV